MSIEDQGYSVASITKDEERALFELNARTPAGSRTVRLLLVR